MVGNIGARIGLIVLLPVLSHCGRRDSFDQADLILRGHDVPVFAVAVSKNSTQVASAGDDGAKLWLLAQPSKPIRTVQHDHRLTTVIFAGATGMVVGCASGEVVAQNGKVLAKLSGPIRALAWCDGTIAAASNRGSVVLRESAGNKQLPGALACAASSTHFFLLGVDKLMKVGVDGAIVGTVDTRCAAFVAASDEVVATASMSGEIRLYTPDLEPIGASKVNLEISSVGAAKNILAVGSQQGRLLALDWRSKKVVRQLQDIGPVTSVSMSGDASFVVSANHDFSSDLGQERVKVWKLKNGVNASPSFGHSSQ